MGYCNFLELRDKTLDFSKVNLGKVDLLFLKFDTYKRPKKESP